MFLSCHFSFPNDTKLNDMLFPNHYQYFSKEQITFLKYHVGVYGILEKHMCLKCTYQKRWLPFQLSVSLLYKVFNITLVLSFLKHDNTVTVIVDILTELSSLLIIIILDDALLHASYDFLFVSLYVQFYFLIDLTTFIFEIPYIEKKNQPV